MKRTIMQPGDSRRRSERGQILVIMIVGIVTILIATSVIIDGGNAWAQQRSTENGADAAALAGATVMVESLGGSPKTDSDVLSAITTSGGQNGITFGGARCSPAPVSAVGCYVDWSGAYVSPVGGGGAIPSNAAGVRVQGLKQFGTYVAPIVGINSLTSGASAMAWAGTLKGICPASAGCPILPLTFDTNITQCAGNGTPYTIGVQWPLVDLATAQADTTGQYEAIVPTCKVGPGGVGWLDMGCGGQLEDQLSTPCNDYFDIPTWLHTSAGNPNSQQVENALISHVGEIILLPLFDGTCRSVPSSGQLGDCTDPGNGNNLYFHIPLFGAMLLDEVHTHGGNATACNSAPGGPPTLGNGSNGCLKGWFVRFISQGPVSQYDPITDKGASLGVQLVR
jgi:Putative Flp pilus-assembly TadE/G-like